MTPSPDDSLESRLRALRPTALPPDLYARLLSVEPPPIRHRPLRHVPVTASLAALFVILLVAVLIVLWPDHSPVSPNPQPTLARSTAGPPARSSADLVYVPASQRSTLLGVSEGEVLDADPAHPVRLVRALWLDDTTYIGEDRSTLHRRTTRTEVVPIALENL